KRRSADEHRHVMAGSGKHIGDLPSMAEKILSIVADEGRANGFHHDAEVQEGRPIVSSLHPLCHAAGLRQGLAASGAKMAGLPPVPISIIIPAYGRQETLLRALTSVVAQDAPPAEIIVVDDGSEPPIDVSGCDTGTIPLTVLRHETNRGAAAARNTGMRASKSEWISFLDSDDHLLPSSLARRWDLLSQQADEGLTVFACGWVVQDRSGKTLDTRLP